MSIVDAKMVRGRTIMPALSINLRVPA